MKTLILFLIGLGLAFLFKGAGRLYATLYRTDATSAKRTIAEHFDLAARLFGGALVFGLLVIAAFLVPPAWAVWALTFGLGLLILLNCSLAGLAGTAGSLGSFLSRPRRWDDLEYQVQMKERARPARTLPHHSDHGRPRVRWPWRPSGRRGLRDRRGRDRIAR